MYVTIKLLEDHMGATVLKPGKKLILTKDPNNYYDEEAIKVVGETGATYGYVSNSVHTVVKGTHSAGYIYNTFDDSIETIVEFVYEDIAIAKLQ